MLTLAETDTLKLITLVGIMIAVVFLATVAILIVRKKILSSDKPGSSGLIMDDFRRLHAQGQLSDAEFQALRNRMAARMKGQTPSTPPAPSPRPQAAPPKALRSERPIQPPTGQPNPPRPSRPPGPPSTPPGPPSSPPSPPRSGPRPPTDK
ncbi:MAG: hypothetical protein QM783_09525 [Phycisphaerales bacterium]